MVDVVLGNLFFNAHLITEDVERAAKNLQTSLANINTRNQDTAQRHAAASQRVAKATTAVISLNDKLIAQGLQETQVFKSLNSSLSEYTFELSKSKQRLQPLTEAQVALAAATTNAQIALRNSTSAKKGASNVAKQYTVDLNKLSNAGIRAANLQQKFALTLGSKEGTSGGVLIEAVERHTDQYIKTLKRKNITVDKARDAEIKYREAIAGVIINYRELHAEARKAGTATKNFSPNPTTLSNAKIRVQGLSQNIGLSLGPESRDGLTLINASKNALKEYTAALNKKNITQKQAQAAQIKFNESIAKVNRGLKSVKAGAAVGSEGVSSFTIRMRNLTSAATLAVGPLSGIGARVTAFAAIAQRSSFALAGMLAAITGVSIGIGLLIRGAVRAGKELETVRVRLESITDYAYAASLRFKQLVTLSRDTGLEFKSLAQQSTLLASASRGTAIEGRAVNKVIEDLAFSAGRFRLTNKQVNSVILAFTQILSKGRVQAEELTGQLAEVLPGAFSIAARAMGVTTRELAKMIKAGEVLAEDFLPKMSAEIRKTFGAENVQNVDSLTAAQNRLSNSSTRFLDTFNELFNVSGIYKLSLQGLSSTIESITDNMRAFVVVSAGVTGGLLTLVAPGIFRGLGKLVLWIGRATIAMSALNLVTQRNPIAILATIASVLVGSAAAATVASTAFKDTTSSLQELLNASNDYFQGDREASNTNIEHLQDLIDLADEAVIKLKKVVKESNDPGLFKIITGILTGNLFGEGIKAAKEINTATEERVKLEEELARLIAERKAAEKEASLIAAGELDYELDLLREKIRQQQALRIAVEDAVIAGQGEGKETNRRGKEALKLIDIENRRIKQLVKKGLSLEDAKIQAARYLVVYKQLQDATLDTTGSVKNLLDFEKALLESESNIRKYREQLDNLATFAPLNINEAAAKTKEEVAEYRKKLEADGTSDDIIIILTTEFEASRTVENSLKVAVKQAQDARKSFEKIAADINSHRNSISFFNSADVRHGEQMARTLADVAYKYSLLTPEQQASTQSLKEYRQALINVEVENKRVANIATAYTATFGAIRGGLDTATKQFSDAVAQWDKELLKFKDISQVIVSEIVNAFLQLAVIKPLIDNIFAGNGKGYFNNVAGSFASIFTNKGLGNATAAAGSFDLIPVSTAGAPDTPLAFARGGIINSPTNFGTSNGPAIAGERGAEAILPLMRDSSGNLGVASSGGNQPIIVNFNFAPGTDESGFRRSQSQIEAGVRQAVQRGARNG